MDKMQNNVLVQVGVIVEDIYKTAKNYAELFDMDIPEVIMTGTLEEAETEYRGKATEARAKLAFFDMGSLQLELIEPTEHPSTWREFLDEHGQGIHHVALQIKGMKETISLMESKGMELVQKGEYEGGRYAYLDAVPQLGMIVELLENDD
ncbi:VOC family protein [Natronospora cellulosivora (SeqCode)]